MQLQYGAEEERKTNAGDWPYPNGPTTRIKGSVRMIADTIHQPEDASFFILVLRAIPIVTKAAMADRNTMASAINPRFTQPNSETGVK